MMMRGWYFGGGSDLWWLLGLVCLFVVVAGLAWLVVTVTRRDRADAPHQPWQPPYPGPGMQPPYPGQPPFPGPGMMPPAPRPTPHDILRERLARGDISVEDFGRTMVALGPDPYGLPPTPPQAPPQA